MDQKLKRIYIPMTETAFYILFALQEERHGYDITLRTKEMTKGQVIISPGTMYGTLAKMEKDGLIAFVREESKRKIYLITALGREILAIELVRIERLYHNSRGEKHDR
ncbi:PadR family transcriptional regulator [Streptococcus gallinaceus]|uniref:DNA-binding PadR family transcriptional regulator n=1 Tax=Streptococcus gallinaceus TaxID=165758 RepID=A0ABV2JLE7_9STRE|nr:PadR family transcriptional regulator [Streptococcus gallinaceus]MCP1639640.1 DNA-binding PadR family transcriptional regulator [Streptococcus gallinaceus]MCP1770423.1 DNA-binding PadR family transcriptional regulator [Streptococcus gallinaceus]